MASTAPLPPLHRAARPAARERLVALIAATLATLVIGYALLLGLAPQVIARVAEKVTILDLLPSPPPPPRPEVPAPKPRQARKEGAASPPNLRSKATPIVAPPPVVPPPPSPVIVAPVANLGVQASTGAADIPGPGTGAGGVGNGTGSGGDGDGDGGGGTDVVQISRDLKPSDVPCFRNGDCAGGTVHMRFTIGVNGRVVRCVVTRGTGDRLLDDQTCAASMQRLRFRPATNAAGRAIETSGAADQRWGQRQPGDEPDDSEE